MSQTPDAPDPKTPTPFLIMHEMLSGAFVTQAIHVVAQLGVVDLLRAGPQTAEALAQATGASARPLYRVLRFLASKGLFTEDAAGHFAATPLGRTLESGALGSLREMVMCVGFDDYWSAIGKLPTTARTGASGFTELQGRDFYSYLLENPDKARVFQRGMAGVSGPSAAAVADAFDFSSVRRLVDVGAGNGTYLKAILTAHPTVLGTLFDRPPIVEGARRLLADEPAVRDRIELVAGDFFAAVPEGADAYILTNILHNWSAEQSIAILANVRRAIAPGGRLFIGEPIIGPSSAPSTSELLDVIMLVVFGDHGGERTEAEHARLLEAAGFRLVRLWPTRSTITLIEAAPSP